MPVFHITQKMPLKTMAHPTKKTTMIRDFMAVP